MTSLDAPAAPPDRPLPTKRELFRLFLSEKHDPVPFYTKLADRSVAEFQFPLTGRVVLDLGSGPGWYSRALASAGAQVIPIDLGERDVLTAHAGGLPAVQADALRLPFADGAFDGVFCSNMLEHVPSTAGVLDEIERVLRPGGWAWVSWTNWYSPWGGHNITPLHYLGPHLGLRAYRRFFGEPPRNTPFEGLWPTYVGRVLTDVRRRSTFRVLDALPRYYPSQRWILRVPAAREVLTWNCLLLLERTGAGVAAPGSAPTAATEPASRSERR